MKPPKKLSNQKKMVPFRPLFRFILARKINHLEKKTKGGIIMAGQDNDKMVHSNTAEIISLGSRAFEYEPLATRPKPGDIIKYTRYEEQKFDHSTESLEDTYICIYDEFVTAIELPVKKESV